MNNFAKRMLVGGLLGALAGVIGAYAAATHGLSGAWDMNSPVFWAIVFNRFSIGALVGLAGVMTVHPIIKSLKIGPVLRGLDIGIWMSLFMGLSILMMGSVERWTTFWLAMISGAIIGVIIDLIITRWYGQGKKLLDYQA